MSREYRLFLEDMRAACEKTIRFSQGLTLAEFLADAKTHDAVMRNLEVIGEAAKHIPEEVRKRNPSVPWRKISGFRDVAAHEYFGIDTDVVWNLITHEVPALLEELKRLTA